MTSWPVIEPVVEGLDSTSAVAFWPGFKVTGRVGPYIEKPLPVTAADLMVSGAVPVDVMVTDRIAVVSTSTSPNGMLVALTLSAATAALNSRAKLLVELPKLALKVTACAVLTGDTVAMNPALVTLAGIVILAGTTTAALLLDRLTLSSPLAAAEFSSTVQPSVPDPVIEVLSQERPLSARDAGAFVIPVPVKADRL